MMKNNFSDLDYQDHRESTQRRFIYDREDLIVYAALRATYEGVFHRA